MAAPENPANLIRQVVAATVTALQAGQGFSFAAPRITLSGEGSALRLGATLHAMGFRSALCISDLMVSELGLHRGLVQGCEDLGIRTRVFDRVSGEPDADTVAEALSEHRRQPTDVVIGIGGGSALDAAKAVAALAGDAAATVAALAAGGAPMCRAVGLACVPTTAGTGSEVTDVAVIMAPDHSSKYVIKGPCLMPDVAVLDGGLMKGLPPAITAATGIDALTHAIEAYVCRAANPLSSALAFWAVQTIAVSLPVAVGNGADGPARGDMALAAYKAGLAFSNAGLGLVHAMSHAIGARYHIPHGVANGLLLTEVMRFNRLVCEAHYAELAVALGVATERLNQRQRALAAIDAVACLIGDIGLDRAVADYPVRAEDYPALAQLALADSCCASNPRQVSADDIVRIYGAIWGAPQQR